MRAYACVCVRACVKRDKGEGGRVGGGREGCVCVSARLSEE